MYLYDVRATRRCAYALYCLPVPDVHRPSNCMAISGSVIHTSPRGASGATLWRSTAEWGTPSVCIGNMPGYEFRRAGKRNAMATSTWYSRARAESMCSGGLPWRDHAVWHYTWIMGIVRVERPWWHWLSSLYPHPYATTVNDLNAPAIRDSRPCTIVHTARTGRAATLC